MAINRLFLCSAILISAAWCRSVEAQSIFDRLEKLLRPPTATDVRPPESPPSESPPPESPPPGGTLPVPRLIPVPANAAPSANNSATTAAPPSVGAAGPTVVVSERPSLGVSVATVTEEAMRAYKLPVRQGALITSIVQGSPAALAGLPLGGVIVAVNGQRIDAPDQLVRYIATRRVGDKLELTYYEGNRLTRKAVTLGPAGYEVLPTPADPAGISGATVGPPNVAAPGTLPPYTPPAGGAPRGNRGSRLAQQLGGNGQRPLLGRIGAVLDDLVAPAAAEQPAPGSLPTLTPVPPPPVPTPVPPPPPLNAAGNFESAQLLAEVQRLRAQVEHLTQRLEELEKRLPRP